MKKKVTKHTYQNMKRFLLSGIIAAIGVSGLNAALTDKFYANTSVLSNGLWVKVGVEKTGVYEISYDDLRAMGFNNPSQVSVFGRGGRVLSESFVTNAGVPVLTDDLTAVKVIHDSEVEKLYFYGLGPEEITFESSTAYETGGFFSRKSNNIYSKRGYYFLTDSKSPTKMTEKSYDTSSAQILEKGISYIYHEVDSVQNTTRSGQLFWGESFNLPNAPVKYWDVEIPYATGKGVMECVIYLPDDDFGDANIVYGFDGTDYFSTKYTKTGSLYYAPHEPTVAPIPVPTDGKGKVLAGIQNPIDMRDYANLDFWVVSYERGIPNGKGIGQQLIAFPDVAKNTTWKLQLENASSLVVLDVTTVSDPQRLKLTSQGANSFTGVRTSSKTPVLVVFDTTEPQLQISGYEKAYNKIENQNLHSLKDEGADFIIITTPKFKPYAEEIARLHREYDKIKVAVATTEECYNEFSGGTPDPMAYRSFARMLYFNECKPKNMLLLGPLYGDVRGVQSERDPFECIIGYQSPSVSVSRGAHNINDFYGMMSDKFRTDYYERNDVQIGVGILPIKFDSEAEIVIDKIKNYIQRDDHAYYLNRFTGVGGIGDAHTHDIQVRDISNHMSSMDNKGTIFTPLAIDTYGNAEARKKFLNQLNEGCNMFSYFGHGAEQFLGKDKYFFNAGDVFSLRNRTLPFALFGGCLITNTDRGFRGLGETIVTATPYGCIGSIVSARDTWSSQNYEFFKQFFTCLYTVGSTTSAAHRDNPVTIGEVYASVKNYSTYSNELAYQLLCDPALIIPTINRSVNVSYIGKTLNPGDAITLSGSIVKANGTVDSEFNGNIVVRLNEPEKTIGAGNVESGEDPLSLEYTYRDSQIAMTTAEVINGKFEVDLHVPASLGKFADEKALVYFSAYDASSKVGGASSVSLLIATPSADSAEASDHIAPIVEQLEFNEVESSILLAVSDNLALNMSNNPLDKGLYLYLDGSERTEAHFTEPILEKGRAAYSKNVMLNGLSYGEHTARIKVKDAAGNFTEQEIIFTYNPLQAKYTIVKDTENSNASVTIIKAEGQMPASSSIIIVSPEGYEVWRGTFQGNTAEWNHCGSDGAKVSAGHYKAYMIETGNNIGKGHSEPIDVPVI